MNLDETIELSQSLMQGARDIYDRHNLKTTDLVDAAVREYTAVKGREPRVLVINKWLYDTMTADEKEEWSMLHPVLLDRDDMILLVG